MKTLTVTTGLALFAVMGNAMAAAENPTSKNQGTETVKIKQNQHQQHRRGPKRIALAGAEGASITLWKPDLKTIPLGEKHVMHGTITLPPTGFDNYHAIVAEKDWGDSKEAIVRYEYLRGKPSKNSPSILSDAVKTEFEIVPDPIPRGHFQYHTDLEWNFITRFKDKPVPDLPVVFETTNGTRIETKSNADGRVTITIPTDFPDMVPGKRDRRSADFILSAEYKDGGINYQSALSGEYRVSRMNWRSVGWGSFVMVIGMVAGGFIGRSRNNKRA